MKQNRGFTLIETLIVIVIITIITLLIFINLRTFRNNQALQNTKTEIVSVLNKARQDTLSSKNLTKYGVHFETDKIVLFSGNNYVAGLSSNQIYTLNKLIKIPVAGGINLNGLNDVIFTRLTGDSNGGTIKIELKTDSTKFKVITINKTGIIDSN